MPRRIEEDHKDFHDVYAGRRRKALGKYINNGSIFRLKGKNGKVRVTIPKIDIPHIVYGQPQDGVGRGQGDPGDVIDKEQKGKGKGNQAGQDEGEGIEIQVDLEEVWKAMEEELKLPRMKPKPNQLHEDIEIKYNDISLTGPESLRHNRRTLLQALKRMCSTGEINKLHEIPGFKERVRLITPINSDKRYRQYREIKIPANNAVIFFARDGSASMDQNKCDIVSDMAWWIDAWIRRFYKRVECNYIWHDTVAQEVSQNKFYKYRYGGGTTCSTALKLIAKQFDNRYPPENWNIFVFYFTDGENWGPDNELFCETIKTQFPSNKVNLVGITQVLAWNYGGSLKEYVDGKLPTLENLRTTSIESSSGTISDEDRGEQIKRAIFDLLGTTKRVKINV